MSERELWKVCKSHRRLHNWIPVTVHRKSHLLRPSKWLVGWMFIFFSQWLIQFISDNNNPTITNEVLINSLKTTNTYCLQGIQNNIKLEDCDENDEHSSSANKFAGLDSVVSVFEEVLVWPTKYTEIFDNSPLRNQAGIL